MDRKEVFSNILFPKLAFPARTESFEFNENYCSFVQHRKINELFYISPIELVKINAKILGQLKFGIVGQSDVLINALKVPENPSWTSPPK